ncbi:ABC transporter permease [Rhizobium rhizogenes]|uniref:ABC transporter permease n=1 Tax=Rhizobium rhizogenes TaxID=359 RepID=UPI001A9C6409|nr:ABC transporter permease [Rhizobium rhizogenes]
MQLRWEKAAVPLAVLITLIGFGLAEPNVLSFQNLSNIVTQASFLAIFAMAQTIVILTRGFDLSLGFAVSLISVVSALVMTNVGGPELAIPLGLLTALSVGILIGAVNGGLIAGVGINPMITTLGTANIVAALASTVSGGFPVTGVPTGLTDALAHGRLFGISPPIVTLFIIGAGIAFMLVGTKFGRSLFIIGANPSAAFAAGINSRPGILGAYALCGAIIAVGAIMLTARTGSGEPNLGGNLTLESIAAAVVGGVKLSGGEGGVWAAISGALFVTTLSNGMNLVGVDGYLQQVFLGLIILVAMFAGRERTQR